MTVDEPHTCLGAGRTDTTDDREIVSFHRRREHAGVEVRSLKNSKRPFHAYSTDFEFFAPSSWQGEVWHRRRQTLVGPGTVACAHPGEVVSARRVIVPGAGNFLTIDARVFHEYLSEQAQAMNNPVLLIHGDMDWKVQIDQSRKMESALKKQKKTYKTVYIKGAGHDLDRKSDRMTLLKEVEDFLQKNIGGGAQ